MNLSVAARIAVRRIDGLTIEQAVRNTIKEGRDLGYSFGLIAINEQGTALVDQTGGKTLFSSANQKGIIVFN